MKENNTQKLLNNFKSYINIIYHFILLIEYYFYGH